MQYSTCPACQARACVLLPAPHPQRAMVSDGAIFQQPLEKQSCTQCGLLSHINIPTEKMLRQFYSDDYALGASTGAAEEARAQTYVHVLQAALNSLGALEAPRTILEVGCGGGLILQHLAQIWPNAHLTGIEAAVQLVRATPHPRINMHHGFIEQLAPHDVSYDFIFAINVIEHARDAQHFLAALQKHLGPRGHVILVCPASKPANIEMLFIDHIYTFTESALQHFAQRAQLKVVKHFIPETPIGDFQVFILAHASSVPAQDCSPTSGNYVALTQQRVGYFNAWKNLDALLSSRLRTHESYAAFGAGEIAALLRCYAPNIWQHIHHLTADASHAPRDLGKDFKPHQSSTETWPILLATHPRSQQILANRLKNEGCIPITWHDSIAC